MAIPQYRVFFDTSVYIAALLSPEGAARELLRLVEVKAIQMVVAEEVIIETDRVIAGKFPELVLENRNLWKSLAPEITPNPTTDQVKPFLQKLARADATILCAAQQAKVAVFVTWNTRDFMASDVQSFVDFPIVIPAEGLKLFRKWIEPFLD
jgi:predicted nucleic acid-binding protein